jgi:hypothetical protein
MENTKYIQLREHLKNVLKTAKKLGLIVRQSGGYSMGYDINNLPPYPVGLFGALSIVEGPGARCKLGLTFDETQSLEAGFNGVELDTKNKKKKKRKVFKIDDELIRIGAELAMLLYKPNPWREWDQVRGNEIVANQNFIGDNYAVVTPPVLVGKLPAAKEVKVGAMLDGAAPPMVTFTTDWNGLYKNINDALEAVTTVVGQANEPLKINKKDLDDFAAALQPKNAQVAAPPIPKWGEGAEDDMQFLLKKAQADEYLNVVGSLEKIKLFTEPDEQYDDDGYVFEEE